MIFLATTLLVLIFLGFYLFFLFYDEIVWFGAGVTIFLDIALIISVILVL